MRSPTAGQRIRERGRHRAVLRSHHSGELVSRISCSRVGWAQRSRYHVSRAAVAWAGLRQNSHEYECTTSDLKAIRSVRGACSCMFPRLSAQGGRCGLVMCMYMCALCTVRSAYVADCVACVSVRACVRGMSECVLSNVPSRVVPLPAFGFASRSVSGS